MAKSTANLQDGFLNQVRRDNATIQIVLLDGAALQGQVRGFDNFTVVLDADGEQHLIYKHAISRIVASVGTVRNGRSTDAKESGNGRSNGHVNGSSNGAAQENGHRKAAHPNGSKKRPAKPAPENDPEPEPEPDPGPFNGIDFSGVKSKAVNSGS